jgi:DNA-binding NtrC family response regulator
MKTILVIEDEEPIRTNILDLLDAEGFEGIGAANGAQGLEAIRCNTPDLVLCDIMMPVLDGIALLERVRADPELAALPIILLTARADRSDLREGMSKGADDYVTKPYTREELLDAIYSRLQRQEAVASTRTPQKSHKATRESAPIRKRLERQTMIVRSEAMRAVQLEAESAAQSPISVLLLGETGSGKEVLAYEIHRRSPRAEGPFVPLNCAALSPTLLESELFGHEKGAYTGADQAQPGLFEMAHGGTIFLDEIGELAPSIQVKLLRVLEDKVVTRVGGRQPRQVDVRLISATHRDLPAEIDAEKFRQDLYYRINGMTLDIPSLRDRRAEIAPLSEHFCQKQCNALERSPIAISPEALAILERYDYPGNVRELKNIIERAVVLCRGDTIEPEHLPPSLRGEAPASRGHKTPNPPPRTGQRPPTEESASDHPDDAPPSSEPTSRVDALAQDIEALEKQRVLAALEECRWNQTKAAGVLGISRRTIINKMKKYGIDGPRKRRTKSRES